MRASPVGLTWQPSASFTLPAEDVMPVGDRVSWLGILRALGEDLTLL